MQGEQGGFMKTTKRQIKAVFYNGRQAPIRTNSGLHPRTMVLCAVDHLQTDEYSASVCEIYDAGNGVLHAVIKRTPRKVEIVYKRDPKEHL